MHAIFAPAGTWPAFGVNQALEASCQTRKSEALTAARLDRWRVAPACETVGWLAISSRATRPLSSNP